MGWNHQPVYFTPNKLRILHPTDPDPSREPVEPLPRPPRFRQTVPRSFVVFGEPSSGGRLPWGGFLGNEGGCFFCRIWMIYIPENENIEAIKAAMEKGEHIRHKAPIFWETHVKHVFWGCNLICRWMMFIYSYESKPILRIGFDRCFIPSLGCTWIILDS